MRRAVLGLLSCSLVLGACGESRATSGPPDVVTTGGGRIEVRNSERGIWTEETRWRLREDLRLGTVDAPGASQFGRIDGVIADSEGRIYVYDGIALEVRVFNADGSHRFTVGGEGQGPTEFSGVTGMAMSPGGHLWLVDAGNNRYSEFDREGDLVATYPRTVGSFAPVPPVVLPDGSLVEWAVVERGEGSRAWYGLRLDPPSTVDTLYTVEYQFGAIGRGAAMTAWDRSLTGAPGPRGTLWVSPMDDYVLYQVGPGGDTLMTASRPSRPIRVSNQERDSVVTFFGQFGIEVEPSDVPEQKLVVRRIVDDGAGHVYVAPHEREAEDDSSLDVFRYDGHYLGRLTLPEASDFRSDQPAPFIDAEHIYLRVSDGAGVHYVVRLRVERP